MCGIFGTISHSIADKNAVLQSLSHRGPDEQNFLESGPVNFYHTRLAIQDLSPAGRQPMQIGRLMITFNGEIYNHRELRTRFGLQHASHSDTATLLLLYDQLGMDMLEHLDGMFAFCLYDMDRGKVFLARDRAGKKPLYYWSRNEAFVFGSELGALRRVLPLELNEHALSAYLYMGYHFGDSTPYSGVQELTAGSLLEIDLHTSQIRHRRWFDMAEYYHSVPRKMDEEEALGELDLRLRNAVQRRIDSSDLEVGAFLSGGIDSGLITAIASEYTKSLKTFTVQLPGAYDESALAAQVADRYATKHTTIPISFDRLRDDLPRIIGGYGEPFFDSSAIPSYYVAKEARQHITVVLNGDGADELFAGYRRYVPFARYDFFNGNAFIRNLSKGLTGILPKAHEKKSAYNYLYRLAQFASYSNPVEIYASATTDLYVGFADEFLVSPALSELSDYLSRIARMKISSLNKMLLADFGALLAGDLLPKMDIATMAHALEGRSPFLGKELLEFAPGLADHYKVRGSTTKYLLRKLAGRYLPPELPGQPKRGFEVPLKHWMDTELNEMTRDYLSPAPGAIYPSLIRPSFVKDLLDRKISVSDEKRAKMLYALLCLEIWHRQTSR